MKIKKGSRHVCIKDVVMEGTGEVAYIKGNVYLSEQDKCITNEQSEVEHFWTRDSDKDEYFIPYSQLDKVYTKYTKQLEKLFDKHKGKRSRSILEPLEIKYFDNVFVDQTGWFCATSMVTESNYENDNYTYLSEQAFIEFMDLGKYIGSLNVDSKKHSYPFPTDWYLKLDNPEVDINVIKDYLRGLEGISSNFIADANGFLLGRDIMGDGSYQHWGSDKQFIENKYNLVEISYQDFLDNVYPKKEVVGDTSQPKHEEEEPYYLNIAEEWSKEGEKEEEVFNPKPYYDNSKGSLYKVATERGWSVYTFDVVKRLERGGKKDPLRQEIEKSIDVLKIWLNELEDEKK